MKKVNQVFDFFDLIEYNEVQKDLIRWASEKKYRVDFPNIFEEINQYENDTRFTIAQFISEDGLRSVWITNHDSDAVEDFRKKDISYELCVEIWFSEELEDYDEEEGPTEFGDFGFPNVSEYVDLKWEDVSKVSESFLKSEN